MREEITVTIDENGKTNMDLKGFKDSSCLAEAKALEEALKGESLTSTKKPEAYVKATGQKMGVKVGK